MPPEDNDSVEQELGVGTPGGACNAFDMLLAGSSVMLGGAMMDSECTTVIFSNGRVLTIYGGWKIE